MEAGLAADAEHGILDGVMRVGKLPAEGTTRAERAHDSSKLARCLLAAAAAGAAPLPEDSLQRLAAAAGWQWQPRRRPAVKRSRVARAPVVRSMRAVLGSPHPQHAHSTSRVRPQATLACGLIVMSQNDSNLFLGRTEHRHRVCSFETLALVSPWRHLLTMVV